MLSLFTKTGMVLSFLTFATFDILDWLGLFALDDFGLLYLYDLPEETVFPVSFVAIGFLFALVGLIALFFGFRAIWRILDGGPDQDFRHLASRLRTLGAALIVVWITIYLRGAPMASFAFGGFKIGAIEIISLDIFSHDFIFLIVAIAILAISGTLERAWQAEDETKHFL